MPGEEVTFYSSGRAIAGTFTEAADPVAAALLVPGGGKSDRNSDARLPGGRMLRIGVDKAIAGALAGARVCALRYDKRGVGASGGEYLRAGMDGRRADARAALGWRHPDPGLPDQRPLVARLPRLRPAPGTGPHHGSRPRGHRRAGCSGTAAGRGGDRPPRPGALRRPRDRQPQPPVPPRPWPRPGRGPTAVRSPSQSTRKFSSSSPAVGSKPTGPPRRARQHKALSRLRTQTMCSGQRSHGQLAPGPDPGQDRLPPPHRPDPPGPGRGPGLTTPGPAACPARGARGWFHPFSCRAPKGVISPLPRARPGGRTCPVRADRPGQPRTSRRRPCSPTPTASDSSPARTHRQMLAQASQRQLRRQHGQQATRTATAAGAIIRLATLIAKPDNMGPAQPGHSN